jgi:hypothetical protein
MNLTADEQIKWAPVAKLAERAGKLWTSILHKERLLLDDRKALGQLFLDIREKLGIKNSKQGFRGSRYGLWSKWLAEQRINPSLAYQYMNLVTGNPGTMQGAARQRITFWQGINKEMKTCKNNKQKVSVLNKAIKRLVDEYGISVSVKVEAK